jgi:KaiC/GvpD/RAD55 family RecA-like ATPase
MRSETTRMFGTVLTRHGQTTPTTSNPERLLMNDLADEIQWQDAVLYRCLTSNDTKAVFEIITPGDFLPGPRMTLATILNRIADSPDTASQAMSEALRLGENNVARLIPELISQGAAWIATGVYYAHHVAENSARRRMHELVTRFQQQATAATGDHLWAAVDDLTTALGAIHRHDTSPDDAFDLDYFEALMMDDRPFTLPGMLAKQDRFLMVGKEGGGKSTLVYQLMTGAAYGVDTMTDALTRYEPQRVLFLDVENSEYQIADQLRMIHGVIKEAAPDVKPVWKSLKRKVVDLTDTAQANAVIRSVVNHQPDLVYMGSAYKMAFSDDYRIMARAIMTTVDRIRAEIGATFLIEHHAGWGDKNDRNGWRPDGSSEWSRWADFSRGMDVRVHRNGQRVMKLVMSSRMDRSAGRTWPVGFEQGTVLPWRPLDADRFEILHGSLFDDEQGGRR